MRNASAKQSAASGMVVAQERLITVVEQESLLQLSRHLAFLIRTPMIQSGVGARKQQCPSRGAA
jgi:hypothetical protein